MSNVQTFELNVIGRRKFIVKIETYGKSEWDVEKFIDHTFDEISKGRNVENCVHYF